MTNSLKQILSVGKVPSSMLLIGADRSIAINLVKELLGKEHVAKIDSGNHPDLHIYVPEGKKSLHPMASMQKLVQEMALPPFEAKSKAFIIEEAEKMLPSSSNALLKTLEEPNEDTFFLLLSNHPDRLLGTIRSRLHPITFTSEESSAIDLSPFFALAQRQEWDRLLDELPEEEPESFFEALLLFAAKQKKSSRFQKIVAHIEEGRKALDHNVSWRNVFLHLILQLNR